MSCLSVVGVACGETAFSMLSQDPAFAPERLYQYTEKDTGETIHVCTWEWVDWTDFGANETEVNWVRSILMLLDQHEDPDDVRFGYKIVRMNEFYEGYAVEFNPPGEAFELGLKVSLDIPSDADLVL